jgi:GNAT superfamily N-acetyltransferase
MHRDLTDDVAASWKSTTVRQGFCPVACDRDAQAIFPAWRAAFPAGHPDHFHGTDERALNERLLPMLSGKQLGPLLACSRRVVDESDRIVAGLVIIDRDGLPWIAEVFRDPARSYPGLGRDLLRLALAEAASGGLTRVELAVSAANPARKVYELLGFHITDTSLTVVVPLILGLGMRRPCGSSS